MKPFHFISDVVRGRVHPAFLPRETEKDGAEEYVHVLSECRRCNNKVRVLATWEWDGEIGDYRLFEASSGTLIDPKDKCPEAGECGGLPAVFFSFLPLPTAT